MSSLWTLFFPDQNLLKTIYFYSQPHSHLLTIVLIFFPILSYTLAPYSYYLDIKYIQNHITQIRENKSHPFHIFHPVSKNKFLMKSLHDVQHNHELLSLIKKMRTEGCVDGFIQGNPLSQLSQLIFIYSQSQLSLEEFIFVYHILILRLDNYPFKSYVPNGKPLYHEPPEDHKRDILYKHSLRDLLKIQTFKDFLLGYIAGHFNIKNILPDLKQLSNEELEAMVPKNMRRSFLLYSEHDIYHADENQLRRIFWSSPLLWVLAITKSVFKQKTGTEIQTALVPLLGSISIKTLNKIYGIHARPLAIFHQEVKSNPLFIHSGFVFHKIHATFHDLGHFIWTSTLHPRLKEESFLLCQKIIHHNDSLKRPPNTVPVIWARYTLTEFTRIHKVDYNQVPHMSQEELEHICLLSYINEISDFIQSLKEYDSLEHLQHCYHNLPLILYSHLWLFLSPYQKKELLLKEGYISHLDQFLKWKKRFEIYETTHKNSFPLVVCTRPKQYGHYHLLSHSIEYDLLFFMIGSRATHITPQTASIPLFKQKVIKLKGLSSPFVKIYSASNTLRGYLFFSENTLKNFLENDLLDENNIDLSLLLFFTITSLSKNKYKFVSVYRLEDTRHFNTLDKCRFYSCFPKTSHPPHSYHVTPPLTQQNSLCYWIPAKSTTPQPPRPSAQDIYTLNNFQHQNREKALLSPNGIYHFQNNSQDNFAPHEQNAVICFSAMEHLPQFYTRGLQHEFRHITHFA